jgi:hypothetical protein
VVQQQRICVLRMRSQQTSERRSTMRAARRARRASSKRRDDRAVPTHRLRVGVVRVHGVQVARLGLFGRLGDEIAGHRHERGAIATRQGRPHHQRELPVHGCGCGCGSPLALAAAARAVGARVPVGGALLLPPPLLPPLVLLLAGPRLPERRRDDEGAVPPAAAAPLLLLGVSLLPLAGVAATGTGAACSPSRFKLAK